MVGPRDMDAVNRWSELLDSESDIRLAFAFGSVPVGRADFDSDIDVAVLASEPLSTDRLMKLTREITMLTGRPVDLIDLLTAGPLIGQQVLREGKLLVCRSRAELADFISRTIIDAADFLPLRNRAIRDRLDRWIQE